MSNNAFLSKIAKYIEKGKLLKRDGKYIVAFSGGGDSMCLLATLHELGYDIEAAHCNFQLRGKDSDNDEMFCKSACDKLGIKIHTTTFDTTDYAKKKKISIEMAARELRYNFFDQLIIERKADGICVGHHANDNLETVLLNMARGTGLAGLQGIRPIRNKIIRPLLCVSRDEIETFLKSERITYCNDFTNSSDEIARNRIRLNVVPELKKINPAVIKNVSLMTKRLADTQKLLVEWSEEYFATHSKPQQATISIAKRYVENEALLFLFIEKYGFNAAQCEDISSKMGDDISGIIFRSTTHELLFDRQDIVIRQIEERKTINIRVEKVEKCNIPDYYSIDMERTTKTSFTIEADQNVCFADAKKVVFPLTIRNVEVGERFIPFGMNNFRLISDYMTDRRKNLFEKERQLVIVDALGKVLWLIGERADERIRIDDNSDEIIIFRLCRS